MTLELKNKMVQKIIQSNDEDLLCEIRLLLGLDENDFWNDLPNEIKKGIDLAKNGLDNGEGIQNDVVMKDIKKRFYKSLA